MVVSRENHCAVIFERIREAVRVWLPCGPVRIHGPYTWQVSINFFSSSTPVSSYLSYIFDNQRYKLIIGETGKTARVSSEIAAEEFRTRINGRTNASVDMG